MVNPPKRSLHCMAPLALLLTLAPRASMALQSLEVFAAGARERNPAALEARASLRERDAEADVALGRVLPGISFDGQYARNQYSSEIDLGALGGPNRTIVLLPKNQWNGTATATVPLVDLANFQRSGAARTEAEAAARAAGGVRGVAGCPGGPRAAFRLGRGPRPFELGRARLRPASRAAAIGLRKAPCRRSRCSRGRADDARSRAARACAAAHAGTIDRRV